MRVDGTPGKIYFRWSGGNLQLVSAADGTVLLELRPSEVQLILASNTVGTVQISNGAVTELKVADGAVSPKKTSENWLEVGASIMADQKHSLLFYEAGAVALSDPNDPIVGVAYNDAQIDPPDEIPIQEGLVSVIADTGFIADESPLKAGWYGRVQLWRETPTTLEAGIDGEDNLFTGASQPGGGPVQIEQATDQAADRGKRVTVVGTEPVTLDPISEVIELDGTDTTTAAAGTVDFENVTGVFFEQDAAANIEIQRASDDAVICTILTGNDNVGAPFMATQTYAYCSKVHVVADAQADEWLTLGGLAPDSNPQLERLQLDNATPGKVTSTNDYRLVTRLITGELDNTKAHTVTAVADASGDKVGKALENATTDGDVIKAYVKPNLV